MDAQSDTSILRKQIRAQVQEFEQGLKGFDAELVRRRAELQDSWKREEREYGLCMRRIERRLGRIVGGKCEAQ